jgi:hypothetical protein
MRNAYQIDERERGRGKEKAQSLLFYITAYLVIIMATAL